MNEKVIIRKSRVWSGLEISFLCLSFGLILSFISMYFMLEQNHFLDQFGEFTLREKGPNTAFFLARLFPHLD